MIHFVTYHVDLKKHADGKAETKTLNTTEKIRWYLSYHASEVDHKTMIDILFASIDLHHPGSKKTILTDESTEFQLKDSSVQIQRGAIDSRQLILSRTKLQLAFLEAQTDNDHVAFVDTDMILNQSLDSIISRDFDIGLTYRPSKDMPINGGLMFIHGSHRTKAIAFFRKFLEIFETRYSDQAVWWGDQSALQDCCGLDPKALPAEDSVKTISDGTQVLLLPCDRYNFRPRSRVDLLHTKQRTILHFMSTTKRWMPFYWSLYSSPLGRKLVTLF